MKTNNNEEKAYDDADLTNDLPLFTIVPEDSNEEEEEEEEEGLGDWGDVDPAGGDEPSAPGSAV